MGHDHGRLLRGAEGPPCIADPLLRELCCLPGVWAKDVKRKPPTLAQPSLNPLLTCQVGRDEVQQEAQGQPRKTSGPSDNWLKGSGTQAIFSSVSKQRGEKWEGSVYQYLAPSLVAPAESGIFWLWVSQTSSRPAVSKGKRLFMQELPGLRDLKGERDKSRLAGGDPGAACQCLRDGC